MAEIDPWGDVEIESYRQTMEQFGIEPMENLAERLPESHRYFRRGIVYGHRDFKRIVKAARDGDDFAMMTGLQPSGKFHFGHKIIADQMKYYQDIGAELYIAVADIESYNTRDMPLDKAREIAIEQYLKNYIALGLEPENVNFYFQSKGSSHYHAMSKLFARHVTQNELEAVYGDIDPGKTSAVLTQVADILQPQFEEKGGSKPVVVPIGTDQDPHLRLTRDIASRFKDQEFIKPSSTYNKFMQGLQGGKMSSSDPKSYIALTDSVEDAKKKIDKAKTGGKQTLEKHREEGADISEDPVYEMLAFHLIDDDLKLKEIRDQYSSGEMLSGELKQVAKEEIEKFLKEHHERLEKAEERVGEFI